MANLQQILTQGSQALNSGQLEVAEKCFDAVLMTVPDEPNALFLLGVVRQSQDRFDESEKLMRLALPTHPSPTDVLNSLGNLMIKMQKPDHAIELYEAAIEKNSSLADSHFNLGLAYEKLSRHEEAVRSIEKACELNPQDVRFWSALGTSLKSLDRIEEALESFNKALDISPDYFKALHNKGVALRMLERPDEALICFKKALPQDDRVPELHFSMACAAYDAGDLSAADKSLNQAISLKADYVLAHETLNKMYWEHGNTDKFTLTYQTAIKRMPVSTELRVAYANQLKLANRTEQAAEVLHTALDELGPAPELHHCLGMLYGQTGSVDFAVEHLSTAVSGDPASERYRIDVANFLIREAQYKEAMTHLEVAESVNPDDQEMWALKGLCWRFTSDDREAWLNNYDLFVQAKLLETPDGYDSFEHFMHELRQALIVMHDNVETPLDQSVRGGTQTPGRLLFKPVKVIQDYRLVLENRIREYLASLPDDPKHPYLRRKAASFRFSGSWSVRLKTEGFHVNHVHPEGWLSGPTYIEVPKSVHEDDPEKAGWVKFGETGMDLGPTRERAALEICPREGLCVFFPAYTWHGTIPFHSSEHRMATPCDVLPTTFSG